LVVVHARYAAAPDAADRPGPRVGFVVSKAVGGAVVRNRTKRVLRHLVAARLGRIPPGCDLVVRANPAAADATTPQLADDLERGLTAVLGRLATPAGVPS
jgi:ribonuclease P protein component